ncbi:c-type cytochrome [Ramlibacter sp. AW1]|uniref:C-type cytochrome n=1 Tax=Ramlibacter aurantiacus TaxID=2801330 RepID=A0A936ZLI7_9BURK|nr:c-type cytochrome [Ramlibacter aurantiacus]MBL0419896.1 c-type cytochrome [Ramlibacter aurantiacus]
MTRRLSLVALALLLLLAAAFAWLSWRSQHEPATAAAPSTLQGAALVERGAYLARAGNCMACHTERGGAPYAGGRAIDTPFGTLHGSNLTPAATGLGAWTADDFWRALHHGRSRDGRLLYPAFPYPNYTRVTRADADALFAYLRSLPAVERANTPHDLSWPVSTQAALAVWRALYFRPGVYADEAGRSAEWNRGAYLVQGLGHCSACHSTRNALGATELMDLSGGMIPMQGWYAPSLASRAEAGLAGWEIDRIVQLLGTGSAPGASTLGPMAEVVLHSTQHLSAPDLRAMAVFLREVPETDASPDSAPPAGAALRERGARLYAEHCAACHGEQGQGIAGAYPPLAGNRAVTMPVTANLVQVVMYGGFPPATQGHPRPFGMPPFALELSDAEVAAVLSFIRGAWGNSAGAVSELDVAQQRGTTR